MTTAKELTRLVWVKWVDSVGGPTWKDTDAAEQDARDMDLTCESVGWVVHEGKHRIMLAQNRAFGCDLVGNTTVIPKVAVVEIQEIKG